MVYMTATDTTTAILDQLNTYEATHDESATEGARVHNIWGDLIYDLQDVDATDAIDTGQNDRFVGEDGVTYSYDYQRAEWRAE